MSLRLLLSFAIILTFVLHVVAVTEDTSKIGVIKVKFWIAKQNGCKGKKQFP